MTDFAPPWTATQIEGRPVTIVDFTLSGRRRTQWFLLSSDRHHDSIHGDPVMEKRHLDEAVRRGAGIIDNGDLFDAMQGYNDPRACKGALKKELDVTAYSDAMVDEAAKFYKPYAANFIQLNKGNHETAFGKRASTDLTKRLAKELGCICGHYAGFIGFRVRASGNKVTTLWAYYHHGPDKGGQVTKGVLSTARMAAYLANVDVVLTGHSHDEWLMPVNRVKVTPDGDVVRCKQWYVRTPGYKDEWSIGDGWAVEKGMAPKGKGAVWMGVTVDNFMEFRPRLEFTLGG